VRPTLPDLPLLHDGDSFMITLSAVGEKCVKISRIVRYPNNVNSHGVEENFRDLDLETKRAVIQQVNRRCVGKTVMT
jgi:hypothetical protein